MVAALQQSSSESPVNSGIDWKSAGSKQLWPRIILPLLEPKNLRGELGLELIAYAGVERVGGSLH